MGCIQCGRLIGGDNLCQTCRLPYQKAWCAAERAGVVERLIDAYKLDHVYAAHRPLAELLLERIGFLPPDTVIVPVPTIPAHIRQRGYDHTLLLARYIAKRRNVIISPALRRLNNAVQRQATKSQRIKQAKVAFAANPHDIDPGRPYLILDDVVTTGATLRYAALALHKAGARHIWAAAVARQPLD